MSGDSAMHIAIRPTAIGRVAIAEEDGRIVRVHLPNRVPRTSPRDAKTDLLREAFRQLDEYLAGERTRFDLPLFPRGTPFQRAVWRELLKIPYGRVATYKDVAVAVGSPRGFRAVGQANHRNPIPIFIPCHRVVATGGGLGGFGGGLALKETLLGIERRATPSST